MTTKSITWSKFATIMDYNDHIKPGTEKILLCLISKFIVKLVKFEDKLAIYHLGKNSKETTFLLNGKKIYFEASPLLNQT